MILFISILLTGSNMTQSVEKRKVHLVPYRLNWKLSYLQEAAKIKNILQDHLEEIHHIGSTSIPGIYAKPIIDIMPIVKDISLIDSLNEQFLKVGYEARGELGIPGRRFFCKGGVNRTHHVHIYQIGSKDIKRHLLFRDYLIAHPNEAQRYSVLKQHLAKLHSENVHEYTAGKNFFVREIESKARFWSERKKTNQLFAFKI